MKNQIHALEESLHNLPRVSLASLPTPLDEHPRLADSIGVRSLYVKRDDLTGLAFGGNKVRELEYFLGEAAASGADVFVAGGGSSQSNHARQCAAAAARVGLELHLVLRRGRFDSEPIANLLVTELIGATIHWSDLDNGLNDREALSGRMQEVASELKQAGRNPWVLPSSFHPLGAVAYVGAGIELDRQLKSIGIKEASIVCTSMGATRIGLDLYIDIAMKSWRLLAMGWRPVDPQLAERLSNLASDTADLLGVNWQQSAKRFVTWDTGGPAYGVLNENALHALKLAARVEGLLLDPVYTSKGFAGLIEAVRLGAIDPDVPVVFLHTGGLPALFAYGPELLERTVDEYPTMK